MVEHCFCGLMHLCKHVCVDFDVCMFVDLTEQELCCVALHETEFMGSHDGHTNHNGKVSPSIVY